MRSFSDKYIANYPVLTKARLGFEFEFYANTPYNKLLELLNVGLKPVKTHGFKQYHSDFKPDADNWKIEPDFSGGPDMVELVTGPMPYVDAKAALVRVLRAIREWGWTDEHCSVHVNISFDPDAGREIADLNPLALVLDFDEDQVYKLFPGRKNNIYAKSIKRVLPFEDWDDADAGVHVLSNHLHLPSDTKYYGVNLQKRVNGYLEFRYIGGKDYEKQAGSVIELMDAFIVQTWNALGAALEQRHTDKLRAYLAEQIAVRKNFRDLDTFLGAYPQVELRVDRLGDYATLAGHYDRFQQRLFEFLHRSQLQGTCVVNYDAEASRLEVMRAKVEGVFDVRGVDLIECKLHDAHIRGCEVIGCDVRNSHLLDSKVRDSDVYKTRVIECEVDQACTLSDCYFMGGQLDGRMLGGVFRAGLLGGEAYLSNETKRLMPGGFWSLPHNAGDGAQTAGFNKQKIATPKK